MFQLRPFLGSVELENFALCFVWDFNDNIGFFVWSYGGGFASNFLGEALFYCPRVECSLLFSIHFASEMCSAWLRVRSWRLIFSRQDFKSSSSSHSAVGLHFFNYPFFFSTSQLLLPAMCPSPQFTHLDSFGHWFVLSLVWSSSPQFRQTSFRLHLVFVCPYLWHLWHIMGRSWYLYTAVSDGCPGI